MTRPAIVRTRRTPVVSISCPVCNALPDERCDLTVPRMRLYRGGQHHLARVTKARYMSKIAKEVAS